MKGENKRVHLTNILNVITRMGNNSFALKGWAVGVMIAVYSFASANTNKAIIVTLIPLVVIWILDAYYLMTERKFRKLYDAERVKTEEEIDFSMNYNDVTLKMGEISKFSIFKAMFSKTVLPFYLVCIITTLIIYFI